jgi:hypothetical protein
MSVPASEVGAVDTATTTSAQPVMGPQMTAALAQLHTTPATSLLPSIFNSASIGNYTLIAIGVILMIGALLIANKETVVQTAAVAA